MNSKIFTALMVLMCIVAVSRVNGQETVTVIGAHTETSAWIDGLCGALRVYNIASNPSNNWAAIFEYDGAAGVLTSGPAGPGKSEPVAIGKYAFAPVDPAQKQIMPGQPLDVTYCANAVEPKNFVTKLTVLFEYGAMGHGEVLYPPPPPAPSPPNPPPSPNPPPFPPTPLIMPSPPLPDVTTATATTELFPDDAVNAMAPVTGDDIPFFTVAMPPMSEVNVTALPPMQLVVETESGAAKVAAAAVVAVVVGVMMVLA